MRKTTIKKGDVVRFVIRTGVEMGNRGPHLRLRASRAPLKDLRRTIRLVPGDVRKRISGAQLKARSR